MAELEANLLQALNIPADEGPSKAYGSSQSNAAAKPGPGRTQKAVASNSRTRKEESPSKGRARQPIATRPQ